MENENVIGKVCFAILRKGFVAGLRISLELDSPGCIIGCKFDGAGIVGNTVIDDSDILLHITSHGIQTEKGHTTGDRSVFYIGVGAALKLSGCLLYTSLGIKQRQYHQKILNWCCLEQLNGLASWH